MATLSPPIPVAASVTEWLCIRMLTLTPRCVGRSLAVLILALPLLSLAAPSNPPREVSISGTRFLLDGKPFPYTGLSFFNAIYNPTFNRTSAERIAWLKKFQRYGVNVLRIWAQWDTKRGFVDSGPDRTLFQPDGTLHPGHLATLQAIAADAASLDMVVQLALFSHDGKNSAPKLTDAASDRAVAELTRALLPHRNLAFQIWNEHSHRVLEHVKIIRALDPVRLVTNSPGIAGVLGDVEQNRALDYLTPHTTRNGAAPHWKSAPAEIAYLLRVFRKPVVDDEPARNGTGRFGGPKQPTTPFDHILQIHEIWQLGAYITYHHDMFQGGSGAPEVPPHGIPDPEFSPYHRQVLEFIAQRKRYMPAELSGSQAP